MQSLDEFFSAYENLFNQSLTHKPNVDTVAGVFADSFLEASPVGIRCGQNLLSVDHRMPWVSRCELSW
jgi:hypothetical protein